MIAPGRYQGPAPRRPGRVRVLSVLLVPADLSRAVMLSVVQDTSTAISDALGAVLLDDAVSWPTCCGVWVSAYLGEDRATAPDNPRLCLIATRLGLTDREFHATARGDALIVGSLPTGVDVDLPSRVLAEAVRAGVPIEPAALPPAGTPALSH